MNHQSVLDRHAPMPAWLRCTSTTASIAFFALGWGLVELWFVDAAWARVVALMLIVLAAPPITTFAVLEVANWVSRGKLKRTGRFRSRSS